MTELLAGIFVFTGLITLLTVIILIVRRILVPDKVVQISINGERTIQADTGESLLAVLSRADIYLPAVCGGRGTCGQCQLEVNKGGGSALPTEVALLSKSELASHKRLGCQLVLKDNLSIRLPDEIFGVEKWNCRVISNHNVSTFITELILELPPGETITFKAGSFIMVECPSYQLKFSEIDIEKEYREEWNRYGLWQYEIQSPEKTTRAYSVANYPEENTRIILNVKLAIPPPDSPPETPPGIVSSYLFNLKPGDQLTVSGPFGNFFAKDTDKEMIFIGGGAGMAPMRSHIYDQLLRIKTDRKISFWYGARNAMDLFYQDEFNQLQKQFDNFEWHIVLSEPKAEDHWKGMTGLIHNVVFDQYLKNHAALENCEYYICGPPMMNQALIKMLEDQGVDRDSIVLDDFWS